ncbi:hypothetical protein BKA62DRAFT_704835 [Auriculariales sp. MPI-PUGE-AT-0066]|nr:hypothetical protein BKA62DRAFT_704835 [Auriculariales sp. MPI-PUGE-AT-0066]
MHTPYQEPMIAPNPMDIPTMPELMVESSSSCSSNGSAASSTLITPPETVALVTSKYNKNSVVACKGVDGSTPANHSATYIAVSERAIHKTSNTSASRPHTLRRRNAVLDVRTATALRPLGPNFIALPIQRRLPRNRGCLDLQQLGAAQPLCEDKDDIRWTQVSSVSAEPSWTVDFDDLPPAPPLRRTFQYNGLAEKAAVNILGSNPSESAFSVAASVYRQLPRNAGCLNLQQLESISRKVMSRKLSTEGVVSLSRTLHARRTMFTSNPTSLSLSLCCSPLESYACSSAAWADDLADLPPCPLMRRSHGAFNLHSASPDAAACTQQPLVSFRLTLSHDGSSYSRPDDRSTDYFAGVLIAPALVAVPNCAPLVILVSILSFLWLLIIAACCLCSIL